jgi:hypothetical protein
MKKNLLVVLAAGMLISACNNAPKVEDNTVKAENTAAADTAKVVETPFKDAETVTIQDRFSLDIPTSMSAAEGLHEDAVLGYQNPYKEMYVIVIDENEDDFTKAIKKAKLGKSYSHDLDGYAKIVSQNFTIEEPKTTPYKDVTINGLPAKQMEITGKMSGHGIYYLLTVVKGKDHYYQVVAWTLLDKMEEHKPIFEKMVATFKELEAKKPS